MQRHSNSNTITVRTMFNRTKNADYDDIPSTIKPLGVSRIPRRSSAPITTWTTTETTAVHANNKQQSHNMYVGLKPSCSSLRTNGSDSTYSTSLNSSTCTLGSKPSDNGQDNDPDSNKQCCDDNGGGHSTTNSSTISSLVNGSGVTELRSIERLTAQDPTGKIKSTRRSSAPFISRNSNCCTTTDTVEHRSASEALHFACWNDAPVNEVEGILYRCPDSIDVVDSKSSKTPLDVVKEFYEQCVCGYCNYNRRKVMEALSRGADYYRIPPTLPLELNISDDDSVDSVCSTNAFTSNESWHGSSISSVCYGDDFSRKSRRTSPQDIIQEETPSLTANALEEMNSFGSHLLSKRRKLWIKFGDEFKKMELERDDILNEEQRIVHELSENINTIEMLKKQRSCIHDNTDEKPKKKRLSRLLSRINQDDANKIEKLDFKIGIIHLDIDDLQRYKVELGDQKQRVDLQYRRLYSSIFGKIDKEIRNTLGKSALKCCTHIQKRMELKQNS